MGEFANMVPIILMLGVFYLVAIKPQMDEKKAHDALVASLTKDDRVVTNAGLHGKIVSVKDDVVVLDVAKGVHLTVERASIARRLDAADGK